MPGDAKKLSACRSQTAAAQGKSTEPGELGKLLAIHSASLAAELQLELPFGSAWQASTWLARARRVSISAASPAVRCPNIQTPAPGRITSPG